MEKRRKTILIILAIIFVFWYCTVFYFSSRESSSSDYLSKSIAYDVFDVGTSEQKEQIIEENMEKKEEMDKLKLKDKDILDQYNFIVRKFAHIFEFLIGGIICTCFIYFLDQYLKQKDKVNNITKKYISSIRAIITILSIGIIIAISDEFHQLFVDGRARQLKDVFIDMIGFSIGTIVTYMLLKNLKERNKSIK